MRSHFSIAPGEDHRPGVAGCQASSNFSKAFFDIRYFGYKNPAGGKCGKSAMRGTYKLVPGYRNHHRENNSANHQ